MNIPLEIHEWIASVFSACNERVSAKLSNIPNAPETTLDLCLIEELSQYSSAKAFTNSWFIRIDTHYIGGLRHYHGWEIADICLLVYFKAGGVVRRSKVALLQSKRLYPAKGSVKQETGSDFEIGISVLADPEFLMEPLSRMEEYVFDESCRYGALVIGDRQWQAIHDHYSENQIPVYYLLYNPWTLPYSRTVPVVEFGVPDGPCNLGARVVPYLDVRSGLSGSTNGRAVRIGDIERALPGSTFGWRLEQFARKVIDCEEGHIFTSATADNIRNLFYRKSGTVAAVIAVSIDLPERDLDAIDPP